MKICIDMDESYLKCLNLRFFVSFHCVAFFCQTVGFFCVLPVEEGLCSSLLSLSPLTFTVELTPPVEESLDTVEARLVVILVPTELNS